MRRALPALSMALLVVVAACSSGAGDGDGAGATSSTSSTAPASGPTETSGAPSPSVPPGGAVEVEVTDVVTGLDTVWAIAFDSKGDLWFTQRGGRLQRAGGPGRDIPGVQEQGEGGLMGLAFDDRDRIHLMLTSTGDNRIVRLDDLRAEPEVIVDGIRKAGIHNGGRIRFGPDGVLYVGTGDAGDTSLPPRPRDLNGKILAVDVDAKEAEVFSIGHRNPQGLCFDADGRFLSTEHGPAGGDEINVITEGGDGGWPDDAGNGIKNYTPSVAPAGCAVYEADAIPQWKGSMLFTTLRGSDLRRLSFGADGAVRDEEVLLDDEFGRLRDVAVGPDGYVYVGTSNKDTRGNPKPGDDRIIRIAPKGAPRP